MKGWIKVIENPCTNNGKEPVKSSSGTEYALTLHVVFVTDHRRPLLTAAAQTFFREEMRDILTEHKCRMLHLCMSEQHMHLILDVTPDICISKTVASIKSVSTRRWFQQQKGQSGQPKGKLWYRNYLVKSCGQANEAEVMGYVERMPVDKG